VQADKKKTLPLKINSSRTFFYWLVHEAWSGWVLARLQQAGKRVGCLHKRWLDRLVCVVLAILHNVIIGLFVRLDACISVVKKVL